LIDQERRRAEFFSLGADGRYHPVPVDGRDVFRSEVLPDFWLKTDWLWQDPLPDEIDVLRELGVLWADTGSARTERLLFVAEGGASQCWIRTWS